jgi:Ca2+-binding RTX toxin-like protein
MPPVYENDAPVIEFETSPIDLITLNDGAAARLFINPGDGQFTGSGQTLIDFSNHEQARGADVGDIDGDGDLDAFIAYGYYGPSTVFLNDGNGNLTRFGAGVGGADVQNVSLGDVDGDGDLDALLAACGSATNGQASYIYLNDGSGNFSYSSSFGLAQSFDSELVDLDGDGDLDAVLANLPGLNNAQVSQAWLNDGNGNFTAAFAFTGHAWDVAVGDVDGDGIADAVFGLAEGEAAQLWLGNGDGTFTEVADAFPDTGSDASGIELADVDGDGDLDAVRVFTASGGGSPNAEVLLNDGAGNFTSNGQTDLEIFGWRLDSGDLDGDGDIDIVSADRFGQEAIWINDGTGQFTIFANTLPVANLTDIQLGAFTSGTSDTAPTVHYTEGNTASVLPTILLSDSDSSTLASATITISGGFVGSNDLLQVDTGSSGLSASFVNGVLTISGTATVETYQAILRQVQYLSGDDPTDGGNNPTRTLCVVVNDGTDDSTAAHVQVAITAINDAPSLAVAVNDQAATEGQLFTFAVPAGTFTDVDSDSLCYSATLADGSPLPSWLTFTPATRTFSGTPPSDAPSCLEIKVIASDGSLTGSDVFKLDIADAGHPPVITSGGGGDTASYQVAENSLDVGIIVATDMDNDAITYSISGGADAALFEIDPQTGALRFRHAPDFEHACDTDHNNSYLVEVSASDGSTADTQLLTIDVTDQQGVTITGNNNANTISGTLTVPGQPFATEENDFIYAKGGNDIVYALGGDDWIDGGAGKDTMYGGRGNDTYIVDDAGDCVIEDECAGTDTVRSSVTFRLGSNIENLVLTGAASICAFGNDLANSLTGNDASNTLVGYAGADVLDGRGGSDFASYQGSASGVNVSLMTGLAAGGDAQGDTLISIESLLGSSCNDTLEGNSGANWLDGKDGVDTLSYEHATGGIKIDLSKTSAQATGGSGTDVVLNFENVRGSSLNDTLTGTAGDNVIEGLAGKDTLSGGKGNDTLIGGAGLDTLTGGAGADRFVFNLASDGKDSITDFATGTDKLVISAAGFGGGLVAGGAVSLLSVTDPSQASSGSSSGYFFFDTSGAGKGTLYWDPTGGASNDAVAIAVLSSGTVSAADFVLV